METVLGCGWEPRRTASGKPEKKADARVKVLVSWHVASGERNQWVYVTSVTMPHPVYSCVENPLMDRLKFDSSHARQ